MTTGQVVLTTGTCRTNMESAFGTDSIETPIAMFHPERLTGRITYFESRDIRLIKVRCGTFHTIFLDNKGRVYKMSSDQASQEITCLDTFHNELSESRVPDDIFISDIAAGRDYSLFLTSDNELYGLGKNDMGQLALPEVYSRVTVPTYIESVNRVLKGQIWKIECGSHFSAILTFDRRVFCWGNNSHGQIDVRPEDTSAVYHPTEIEFLRGKQIEQLSLGWKHALALSTNGELFAFGQKGLHLGYDSYDDRVPMLNNHPHQPNSYFKRNHIRLRTVNGSAEHSYAVGMNGELYTFGSDDFCARGIGDEKDSEQVDPDFPNLRKLIIPGGKPIVSLASGWHNCFCYCSDGSFYAFGENGKQTIALKKDEVKKPQPFLCVELEELKGYCLRSMSAGGQDFCAIFERGMSKSEQSFANRLDKYRKNHSLCDVTIVACSD